MNQLPPLTSIEHLKDIMCPGSESYLIPGNSKEAKSNFLAALDHRVVLKGFGKFDSTLDLETFDWGVIGSG